MHGFSVVLSVKVMDVFLRLVKYLGHALNKKEKQGARYEKFFHFLGGGCHLYSAYAGFCHRLY